MAGQTISKLALGAVGEKHPQAATVVAFGIVGVALFALFAESALAYYAAALLFGCYYGITNVMMPLFARRVFGNRDYAPIYAKVPMMASASNAVVAPFSLPERLRDALDRAFHVGFPQLVDELAVDALANPRLAR